MKWNGIFSNRYIHTIMDCNKYCQDIENKIYRIHTEKREIQPNIKDRLTPNTLDRRSQLDDNYEKLSDEVKICIADCERRKRHRSLGEEPPIDEELKREFKELESDDDDDLSGGNKRRHRRRSFRNKTKRTQRRGRQKQRNQRCNTRRGRGRSRITRRHRQ